MKYKKRTLPNGVRLITVPTPGNPSVTVMVMAEVGSDYESKNTNGLSHFLEHMLFKGSKKRSAKEIARELDSLGAHNNAFTSSEVTGYHAKAHKKHFVKVLDIVSDMYLNPTLPADELEKERGVILEEISMYEDLPQRKVWDVLSTLMYGDSPAGRTVLGTRENIKRFQRKDFVNYFRTHYIARKTIVVVAGDVEESLAYKEVQKIFGSMNEGKLPKKSLVKENQKSPALKVEKRKTDQAHMVMAFRTVPAKDERVPAISVLSTVMGGGMSSRLYQRLREEMGACYYIRVKHEEYTDHGLLAISTGINAARSKEVTEALLGECKRLREENISADELSRAQEYIIGHLYMDVETSDVLADFYGEQEVSSGKLQTPEELAEDIRKVTADDVRKAAQMIFKNENINLAAVGNLKFIPGLERMLKF